MCLIKPKRKKLDSCSILLKMHMKSVIDEDSFLNSTATLTRSHESRVCVIGIELDLYRVKGCQLDSAKRHSSKLFGNCLLSLHYNNNIV